MKRSKPVILVANKCVLSAEGMIDTSQGLSLTQKLGEDKVAHVECSVKFGVNVKEVNNKGCYIKLIPTQN